MSSDLLPLWPATSNSSLADRIAAHRRSVGTFLLLDCSYSMASEIAPHERAIDKLRKVARQLRLESPQLRQIAFPMPNGEEAAEITTDIHEPCGQTPLAGAIDYAAARGAVHLIIVSDGQPDSESAAKTAAKAARCRIDVCFVGAPGSYGEAFLRQLASLHGGSCDTLSLATKALETRIRGLLSA
jgi:Mg-chelatase subunit ChlD